MTTLEADCKPKVPEPQLSICPAGRAFPLPQPSEYAAEFERLTSLVDAQRAMGREIVVVMGVGFVGAVMAGVVADSVPELEWKETMNKGRAVFRAVAMAEAGIERYPCVGED
jgi:sugar phosphate isomerase/epimerase